MSKQVKLAIEAIIPASVRDAGQMAARAGDSLAKIARWCGEHIPNYPAASKEDRALFKEGALIHYATVKAPVFYRREGTNLIRLDKAPDKFGPEHVRLDVAYCTGLTNQAFGALKSIDKPLYDAINEYRDDCNVYASNRWNAVARFWAALTATTKKRGPSDPFKVRMGKAFETMGKAAVVRRSHGDDTAPTPDKFKAAVKAFWAELAK